MKYKSDGGSLDPAGSFLIFRAGGELLEKLRFAQVTTFLVGRASIRLSSRLWGGGLADEKLLSESAMFQFVV